MSRGAAAGDIDNDGDSDVLVTNNAGPARLLLNRIGSNAHWVGLRPIDPETDGDVSGARVAIVRTGEPPLWRRAEPAAPAAI